MFANAERFPEAEEIVVGDFAEGVASLDLTPNSYVLVATRGHKYDDEALLAAARSKAGYVGLLGSKRKAAMIFRRLFEEGVDADRIGEIRAPRGTRHRRAEPGGDRRQCHGGGPGGAPREEGRRPEGRPSPPQGEAARGTGVTPPASGAAACAGVLLAAGESSRMGRPKQTLDWLGEPLVVYQTRQLLETGVGQAIVVLGHEAEAVRPLVEVVDDPRLTIVVNEDYLEGKTTSIKAGLRAMGPSVASILLLGCRPAPPGVALLRRLAEAHAGARGAHLDPGAPR